MRCFIIILVLPTRRYHPCYFRESPLPGNPDNLWRFKSGGHHTEGFETLEEAKASAIDLGAKIDGHDSQFYGMLSCPADCVITDSVVVTTDPEMIYIMPPFERGKFAEAFAQAIC